MLKSPLRGSLVALDDQLVFGPTAPKVDDVLKGLLDLRALLRLEAGVDTLGDLLADVAIGVLQHRHRLHQGATGTAQFIGEVDRDRRGQLVEQPGPCREAGLALLGDDGLLGLRQQVRPAEPKVVEVVAAEVEARVGERYYGRSYFFSWSRRARRTTNPDPRLAPEPTSR